MHFEKAFDSLEWHFITKSLFYLFILVLQLYSDVILSTTMLLALLNIMGIYNFSRKGSKTRRPIYS